MKSEILIPVILVVVVAGMLVGFWVMNRPQPSLEMTFKNGELYFIHADGSSTKLYANELTVATYPDYVVVHLGQDAGLLPMMGEGTWIIPKERIGYVGGRK